RMAAFEGACGNHFDHVIAVSRQDARIFAERYGWRDVDAIDTAVDTDLFEPRPDRKSTRLNSSHVKTSYAVFCLKKKKKRLCRRQARKGVTAFPRAPSSAGWR